MPNLTPNQRQTLQALILQEAQENANLAQLFHKIALIGYSATIGFTLITNCLVCTGHLDQNTAVDLVATLPILASTRALQQGGKQLQAISDRLRHLIEL